eukprot:scaffold157348_cov39-Prasinocladus_malaysianus.AAC.1
MTRRSDCYMLGMKCMLTPISVLSSNQCSIYEEKAWAGQITFYDQAGEGSRNRKVRKIRFTGLLLKAQRFQENKPMSRHAEAGIEFKGVCISTPVDRRATPRELRAH